MAKASRREFLGAAVVGGAVCLSASAISAVSAPAESLPISPGCRRSKVKVAKLYLGIPGAHWPTPKLDLKAEVQRYEGEFARRSDQLADVDFVANELVTSADRIRSLRNTLQSADGILLIHLSMGIGQMLSEVLSLQKPTMLFAAPYSGHEWTGFGWTRNQPQGALLDCMLTSDYNQLLAAIRPFRAIHHLSEAKIVNISTRDDPAYAQAVKERFGTTIKTMGKERVIELYNSVSDADARGEAERWISRAERIVEPSREDIVKSARLALALQRLLDEEEATVMTVDCYGTMWRQLPAYPCLSHCRMNNMGYGGICESDLQCAVTHIILQGLSGKPAFVSDPTVDTSRKSIILAHCMGSTRMDGPKAKDSRFRFRTIMERQEGATVQAFMRVGQKVTQAILLGTDQMRYFTGTIIATPDVDRGCRTKIEVQVDGDIDRLWQNWGGGLHRQTCYGDLTEDLKRFCKFKRVNLVQEA
ncbi:MAG: hypothetical protein ACUVTZ_01760 [Armatimonadota bacterium]